MPETDPLIILRRPWHAGSRVTNCVVHARLGWDKRPRSCDLCWTDMSNHISYCHRLNEFMNETKEEAICALLAQR